MWGSVGLYKGWGNNLKFGTTPAEPSIQEGHTGGEEEDCLKMNKKLAK